MSPSCFGPLASLSGSQADNDADGKLVLSELLDYVQQLGIEAPNAALLFAGLDVDGAGFLTRDQFEVMSRPRHVFRLSNLAQEEWSGRQTTGKPAQICSSMLRVPPTKIIRYASECQGRSSAQ